MGNAMRVVESEDATSEQIIPQGYLPPSISVAERSNSLHFGCPAQGKIEIVYLFCLPLEDASKIKIAKMLLK